MPADAPIVALDALDGDAHELSAGEVTRFDGSRGVAPLAVEDTRAILVLD